MTETIQRSFTSGEISPSLQSRADTTKYNTGLNLCENFFVKAQGGVYSRPGFRFVGELDDQTKKGRLKKFVFNTEQTYMLVFEHLKVRVIKDGGFVLDGASIFELATPFTEDQLPDLGFTQSADVMTIVHHDHDPMSLNRLVDDNWTLTTISYSPVVTPPSFAWIVNNFTITNITQGAVGIITVAESGLETGNSILITGVVGMTELNNRSFIIEKYETFPVLINAFELVNENTSGYGAYVSGGIATRKKSVTPVGSGFGDYLKTYQYVITAVNAEGVESLQSAPARITNKSLSTTGGIRLQWNVVIDADHYRVYKENSLNTDVYGWVGDSKNLKFDDYNIAPTVSDAPPENRIPFDGVGNKPSIVNYYQQRQLFANTLNEPQAVFTTQTGNYVSLRTSNPARDDDAITFTIAGQQVNEIRHIVAINSLLLLTAGCEWKVTEGQEKVLTPSTMGVRPQSYNGASKVPPVIINSTVVYVQEKGARIRDLAYEFISDNYTGNDLSLMALHLFEGFEIISMAYAAEPDGILYCIRDDGVLLGFTYQKEHKVWGWHQHSTPAAGKFEWVESVTEEDRDVIYAIIKRTINGVTKRYVERLETREQTNSEDCFYVDSGLSYNGSPVTVISGLDHLEGEEVIILADGNVVNGLTVSDGAITLLREASKVHVGLAYVPAIETLDIDIPSAQETLKSRSVSVSKVYIEVEKSRGGWIGPRSDVESGYIPTEFEIKPRFDSDGYESIQLKTFKQEVIIDPLWAKGGGIRIEQRSPLPLSILSIIPDIDVGGN